MAFPVQSKVGMVEGKHRIIAGRKRVTFDTDNPVYSDDEVEFLKAIQTFKLKRPYPTWAEVLRLVKSLGYRKA